MPDLTMIQGVAEQTASVAGKGLRRIVAGAEEAAGKLLEDSKALVSKVVDKVSFAAESLKRGELPLPFTIKFDAVPSGGNVVRLADLHASRAAYNQGVSLMNGRSFGEAAAAFREALRLHPEYGDQHLVVANIMSEQGNKDYAIREYEQFLKEQPQSGLRRTVDKLLQCLRR